MLEDCGEGGSGEELESNGEFDHLPGGGARVRPYQTRR